MKHKIKNMIFLSKLSWQICPYLYFSMALEALLQIIRPFIYILLPKFIIDALTISRSWHKTLIWISIFIGTVAVYKALDLLTKPYRNKCVNQAEVDTVKHYMRLSTEMDYDKLENSQMRDLKEVMLAEIRGNTIVNFYSGVLTGVVQLIGYAVIIISLSPYILLIMAAVVVVKAFVNNRQNQIENDTIPGFKRNGRRFNYIDTAMSHFSFAKEVRINNVDAMFERKYDENIKERWALNTSYNRRLFTVNSVSIVTSAIQILVVYGYVSYKALLSEITLGSFSMYLGAIGNITDAFSGLVENFFRINLSLRFVDQYRDFRQKMRSVAPKSVSISDFSRGAYTFEFRHVSFRYPNTDKMVLKDINIVIKNGEKLSVVGPNGAGKTTFVKLLCRLYVPTEGTITLNGVDIQMIDRDEYARLLSVVFQDFRLFSFDVAENIALNQPLDENKLLDVVEKADLTQKIKRLPKGIHTYVNKEFDADGVEFSGGESQKLVLARAYYKNSPLVILDEPSASMDPMAELYLYKHFNAIIGDKSAVFISHRLASCRFCDEIAVFREGRVVEQGTHDALMKLKGFYCKMFSTQADLYTGGRNEHEQTS